MIHFKVEQNHAEMSVAADHIGMDVEKTAVVSVNGASVKIGVVHLLAAAWVGSDNLYSQVVSIKGVTNRSQVDITPDAELLTTFHEKDLALVAENEDGIVTVYAIGQKPVNDYTIQVTITEVSV